MGSVAPRHLDTWAMNTPTLLVGTAEIALIATAVLYLVLGEWWTAFVRLGGAAASTLVGWLTSAARRKNPDDRTVGLGTVRSVGSGEHQIFVEVVAVSGETFIGKLARSDSDPDISRLRPGLVVLVAFDPAAREQLSLPDDVLAVRAQWLAAV